ncbi:MAG: ROK family protein [Acidobacteria bacterium]|nr:ROK family protein [Acidobacteriota bacterium]
MATLIDPDRTLIGIDVRRNGFRWTVFEGDEMRSSEALLPTTPDSRRGDLFALIRELKEAHPSATDIGLAIPGLVDHAAGIVTYSASLPELSGGNLAAEIKEDTGLVASLENDANAAAFGEFGLGAGLGERNIFFATLGEGVGGAFIFDGKIWRGAGGYAGEFGFISVNSEGMRLEEVASAANIVRRTRERFRQDHTSSLSKLDEQEITIDAIVAAACKDDDFAGMMLERTGVYVGSAIATVINLINIDRVVVGGDIMEAKNVVLNAIIHRARELSFGPSFASTAIVAGELGPNAAAAGAAILSSGAPGS